MALSVHARFQAEAAGEVLRAFIPADALPGLAAIVMAAIHRAHATAPSGWALTLKPGQLRLNVGPVEVLTATADGLSLCTRPLPETPGRGLAYRFTKGRPVYPAVPIASAAVEVPISALSRVRGTVRTAFLDYIDAAAARKKSSSWKAAHQPGAVRWLATLAGVDALQPTYLKSDDTEATKSGRLTAASGHGIDLENQSKCFTHYWAGSTCADMAKRQEGFPLDHIADDRFVTAGVRSGDRIYVVSIRDGQLYLIGRMEVGERLSQASAERRLREKLWDAEDHLIARSGSASPMRFSRIVSDDIARRLRFDSKAGPLPLAFKADGRLDGQTLRTIRRLTPDSAQLLEALIGRDEPGASVSEITLQEHETAFNQRVAEALRDSAAKRRARLTKADPIPRKIQVLATAYERNADVVAEVLERADGVCERCRQPAPFFKASNGQPYLEVHHRQPLAAGGPDTVENAIALCPNCHRGAHHGPAESMV